MYRGPDREQRLLDGARREGEVTVYSSMIVDQALRPIVDGFEATRRLRGHGYDRIDVTVRTDDGEQQAMTYAGLPAFINDACLPTRRYLNILLQGAVAARLDPDYIEALRRQPVQSNGTVPPCAAEIRSRPTCSGAGGSERPSRNGYRVARTMLSRAVMTSRSVPTRSVEVRVKR